jgi:iron complex transport system ATP-binding protein
MISNNNILTTSNLSIGYTSTTIIAENLNLNLQAGKLIALIGANGIGKSTLRTITGFRNRFQERPPLTVKNSSNRCLDCSAEPKCGTN